MKKRLLVGTVLLAGMVSLQMNVGAETLVGVSSSTGAGAITETEAEETDVEVETEMETETETETERVPAPLNGWKVAIDPGHQGNWVDMSELEPSAPGSSEMKAKATTGTTGRFSGLNEYELNLGVSKVLKEELIMRGYEVVMTREDHDTAISNKERAELAAKEGADILVRIHANGSDDSSVGGALTMVPSSENPYVGNMFDDCYELGELILNEYCKVTEFSNLGVGYYDNMSGINWSTIPVTILEMGFMSNEYDDLRMADENFWPTMADGIANGIDAYFAKRAVTLNLGDEKETEKSSEAVKEEGKKKNKKNKKNKKDKKETEKTTEAVKDEKAEKAMHALHEELFESMAEKASAGENWAAAAVDLTSGESCLVEDEKMQAASLIKLYIAGAIYEKYDEICEEYGQEYVDGQLYTMITISDNYAANTLATFLGDGDPAAGRAAVTEYCKKNGYDNSEMGRMLLASKETGDNFTSVGDCAKFLTRAYNGELPHSEDILKLLKSQERTHKIPAGLPEGVISGNKTGELADVENDVAIIFNGRPYVLCIMSEYLRDVYDAQQDIAHISTEVYRFIQKQLG